ncbi:MAG: hypothetical protein ACLP01_25895 [Solirubrobacteraceae bacterium]
MRAGRERNPTSYGTFFVVMVLMTIAPGTVSVVARARSRGA